jgi:hypothetical protein
MEQVSLLDLRKEKTVECCNIARAAKSSNKIAADGEKKFPAFVVRAKPCGCHGHVRKIISNQSGVTAR